MSDLVSTRLLINLEDRDGSNAGKDANGNILVQATATFARFTGNLTIGQNTITGCVVPAGGSLPFINDAITARGCFGALATVIVTGVSGTTVTVSTACVSQAVPNPVVFRSVQTQNFTNVICLDGGSINPALITNDFSPAVNSELTFLGAILPFLAVVATPPSFRTASSVIPANASFSSGTLNARFTLLKTSPAYTPPITSVSSFTVTLPNPIDNVVFLEWVSSRWADTIISIDEWNANTSTKGPLYWRYIDGTGVNGTTRVGDIDEKLLSTPKTLRNLTIRLFSNDGTFSPSIVPSGYIELQVFSRIPQANKVLTGY